MYHYHDYTSTIGEITEGVAEPFSFGLYPLIEDMVVIGIAITESCLLSLAKTDFKAVAISLMIIVTALL
jgi:hypothetical protein